MKNIFELYTKDIDLDEEIMKLYEIFYINGVAGVQAYGSPSEQIDYTCFSSWQYRCGCINCKEFQDKIEKYSKTNENRALLTMEFLFNIIIFHNKLNKLYPISTELKKVETLIIDNIHFILSKMGYETKANTDQDGYVFIRKNADLDATLKTVPENTGKLLIEYCDFKISTNIVEKEKILFLIYKKFESIRGNVSKDLSNLIGEISNNLFRHNEKKRTDLRYNNLKDKDRLEMMDLIFVLLLSAFRNSEIENLKNEKDIILSKYTNNN